MANNNNAKPYFDCPDGMTDSNCPLNKTNTEHHEKDFMGDPYLVPDFTVSALTPTEICNFCKAKCAQKTK